jgi:hypothetical protein
MNKSTLVLSILLTITTLLSIGGIIASNRLEELEISMKVLETNNYHLKSQLAVLSTEILWVKATHTQPK